MTRWILTTLFIAMILHFVAIFLFLSSFHVFLKVRFIFLLSFLRHYFRYRCFVIPVVWSKFPCDNYRQQLKILPWQRTIFLSSSQTHSPDFVLSRNSHWTAIISLGLNSLLSVVCQDCVNSPFNIHHYKRLHLLLLPDCKIYPPYCSVTIR